MKENAFDKKKLAACAEGKLFGEGNAQLPATDMLMFDRIVTINETQGDYNRGEIIAELDIHDALWFFQCHFINDPVMPGCLGLDAMWQLTGFFLAWKGLTGKGRALGCGEVKFSGQVLPSHKKVTYHIHIKRVLERRLCLGIADGIMSVDGKTIYEAQQLKVGLFHQDVQF